MNVLSKINGFIFRWADAVEHTMNLDGSASGYGVVGRFLTRPTTPYNVMCAVAVTSTTILTMPPDTTFGVHMGIAFFNLAWLCVATRISREFIHQVLPVDGNLLIDPTNQREAILPNTREMATHYRDKSNWLLLTSAGATAVASLVVLVNQSPKMLIASTGAYMVMPALWFRHASSKLAGKKWAIQRMMYG